MPTCWNCQKPLDVEKIYFRTICESCHAYQHACINCKHYFPGKPNDCNVPGTDPVTDRRTSNLCDSFEVKGPSKIDDNYQEKIDRAKKLFGD